MTKRPNLNEALNFIRGFRDYNSECANLLVEYDELVVKGQEFLAARLVVETVVDFNTNLANTAIS